MELVTPAIGLKLMRMGFARSTCISLLGLLTTALALPAQEHEDFEDPPINYSATLPKDIAAKINAAFADKADEIRSWPARKRLRWLLEQCNAPVESQLMVFSKTSLQRDIISPSNPRVLYFSDEAYIGWVPGGSIELTVFDPTLGATFYTLDAQATESKELLHRSNECLSCHKSYEHTPSLRDRSIYPDALGEPLSGSSTSNIEASTPLQERWGGWYVTGIPGDFFHRGNTMGKSAGDFEGTDALHSKCLATLPEQVDPQRYLKATSDIIPLIVHDHQVYVHNVLAHANLTSRLALYRWPAMRDLLGLPEQAPPAGSCLVVFNNQAEKIIEALLCKGEPDWPTRGIQGNGEFEKAYAKERRPDTQGRALRDLDLKTRLFRYRCSPLIYSQSFATLPPLLREIVLQRLAAGLQAAEPTDEFKHLPADERKAIYEIIKATLPDLPKEWH